MWNRDKSILLTRVFTVVLTVALVVITAFSYWLVAWFGVRSNLTWRVLVPYYTCVPVGFVTLYLIWKLVGNISKGVVFVPQNVTIIRGFSWCLIFVGIVSFVAGFFYLPYFLVCGASLFMAAIMRVLKNVMAQAVEVKTENDMTV